MLSRIQLTLTVRATLSASGIDITQFFLQVVCSEGCAESDYRTTHESYELK